MNPIFLIEAILQPVFKNKRHRFCPTKIKILYQLYLTWKNVKNQKWKNGNNPSKSQIADWAKVSTSKVTKFITDQDFLLFGKILRSKDSISKKNKNNIYTLHDWVIEAFWAFERLGMMRGFQTNFDRWKEIFLKRFNNYLLPLLEKGFSLTDIVHKKHLMNKLSTKNKLKGATENPLKGASPTPYGPTHYMEIEKVREIQPYVNDTLKVQEFLSDRFQMKDGDIHTMLMRNSLNDLKKAMREGELWLSRGMIINSPPKVFQTIINRVKNERFR